MSLYNSIIMGWPQGILIDGSTGTATALNIEDSTLRLRNITFAGNAINWKFTGPGSPNITSDATLNDWFVNRPIYGNDYLTNTADAKLIQPFNYAAPDPTPFGGSNGNQKILTGGEFSDVRFTGDTFFDRTATFRGAIAPTGPASTWWKGWTVFISK